MKYLAIFAIIFTLFLIPTSYSMLEGSKAVEIVTFGLFDTEEGGNLVDQLYVGEKYWFYIEYKNALDIPQDIKLFLQMIDKNKPENNILKKIEGNSILEPSTGIFNGMEDGFTWTPEYPGQFKITATFTALDNPLIEVITHQYDFVVMDRPSLKQQIKDAIPLDDIICKISTHYLVKRNNDKLACIDLNTAKKLDLKPIDSNVMFLDSDMKESLSVRYKNQPEVVAFYATYPDTIEEVRDDHISYVAGSDDGFKVRMKLFFDDKHNLDHIEFHCYYQKIHQLELAQEDLATKLEKYNCKEYAESKNEN
ncbi:hypothetical protein [Nitrosarchaeum sp.]|uniref:hypothetical protein n=1 Tax=Nitrosarchaeum sp. TaxID=2026886 RepID=UPI00247C8026|nr:hypothetical protein [Nitrosarchaeum sp.]MCV0413222.1 hypothetical protein [Nitrosarchaeum sp.]